MIKRLLIANRGEIAVRIIRACKELGIGTVAVYSTADQGSLHTRLADRAVCIGPPAAAHSYLNRANVITAALAFDCDALHPGVGFLSENADFARLVNRNGLCFIGPDPAVLELLGDKVRARETAGRFGLPVTPGTEQAVADGAEARKAAAALGFPVIIKAAAGGGGKGMRVVREESELEGQIALARAEAGANFADDRVFIERYLENPRHVELQMLADGAGKVAVLGERDCSVQKNHQKLIEESPSPGVNGEMRDRMAAGAVRMFRELSYCGAGTVEFLASGTDFYFMEVNARVQVEHPVSECVTGVDIIREQITACAERRIDLDPEAVRLNGWAIECRINALGPGRLTALEVPGGPGVRFDSFLYAGCAVPPHYDAMVAKLIAHGKNRDAALARMDRALGELVIEGIATNRTKQRRIMRDPVFRSGDFGTSYYEEYEQREQREQREREKEGNYGA
ncbi:MAG: ATP-grasp domain-containing protein [Spirochaetaceae bacterium]|jgi:acetyl-CoA carboxylase biotin carboxylase subunit|nr:ATP-grasp domain-containing protein [Spirochaetaceae bacterium]